MENVDRILQDILSKGRQHMHTSFVLDLFGDKSVSPVMKLHIDNKPYHFLAIKNGLKLDLTIL